MSGQAKVAVDAAGDLGVWVYAIARADRVADRTAGLRGVAEEPLRAVFAGGMAAVVGTVRLDEFRGATANARAHNAVVNAVRRGGFVIPVRPATIYRDDRRVCQLLLKEHEYIRMALRRVSGRDELVVTAYADPKSLAVQGDLIHTESTEGISAVAHLRRRRRQLAAQQEGYRLAAAEADRIHAVLLRCAVDGKRRSPPTDRSPSGKGPWPVLNGSYLVDGDAVGLFTETAVALEKSTARITLEVSGPWPPYSFAEDLVAI